MRLLILGAGALALAACGTNGQSGNAAAGGENLTAESIVSNDVTAIDAVTGENFDGEDHDERRRQFAIASGEPDDLVRLQRQAPLRPLHRQSDRCLQRCLALLAVHRLHQEMVEGPAFELG